VGFSALGLTIAYLDRAALSVAMPFMSEEFHISPAVKGLLLSAFFWTYALFQIPSGWLLDRFGPRVIYPIAVGWWSIWTALTAAAHGVGSVIVFRLGLGIGEAPVQPANVKVVSRWFPRRERAFASSLFDMGQQIGTALSVPIVTALAVAGGWRLAFVVIGAAGLLWILGWVVVYRDPEQHPRVSPAELAHIQSDQGEMVAAAGQEPRWRPLLRDNQVWALTAWPAGRRSTTTGRTSPIPRFSTTSSNRSGAWIRCGPRRSTSSCSSRPGSRGARSGWPPSPRSTTRCGTSPARR
jgi:MFS transporter, ACS family, D-galactonate transporter